MTRFYPFGFLTSGSRIMATPRYSVSRLFVSLLSVALLAGCSPGNDTGPISPTLIDTTPPPSGWALAWSDEFEPASFNAGAQELVNWDIQLGDGTAEGLPPGWGNSELQIYSADNISIETVDADNKSVLVITARETMLSPPNPAYTSARIRTQGKFDFTYGRVEASIKLPASAGLWSAFWMLGSDNGPYGGWPARGEIDILEAYDRTNPNVIPVSGALHFGTANINSNCSAAAGPLTCISETFTFAADPAFVEPDSTACLEKNAAGDTCTRVNSNVNVDISDCLEFDISGSCVNSLPRCTVPAPCPRADPADDFHEYAVEWDAEYIRWYIDGEHFYSVSAETYWNYAYDDDLADDGFIGYFAGGPSAPFDANQHIILNVAIGGNLANPGPGNFVSDRMEVDYVRVYQCTINPLDGTGCAGTFDPIVPFREFDVAFNPGVPVTQSYDLYVAGVQELFGGINLRALDLFAESTPGLTVTEGAGSGIGHSQVIQFSETGLGGGSPGYTALVDSNLGTFNLLGMGGPGARAAGELKFSLYIDAATDPATDIEIGLQSATPTGDTTPPTVNTAFTTVDLSSISVGEWTTISVKMNDIVENSTLDMDNINGLFLLKATGAAELEIDDVQLTCGSPTTCRILSLASQPEQVYGTAPQVGGPDRFSVDAIGPLWDRGIAAFDSINGDYNVPVGNHVTWQIRDLIVDVPDLIQDNVIEVNFGTQADIGLVFIGANSGQDLSGYVEGALVFDILVLANPANAVINYKVDEDGGQPGEGTGEQPIFPQPVTGIKQTVRVATCALRSLGLDDDNVIAPIVIVPEAGGNGLRLQLDNIYYDFTSDASCELVLPLTFEIPGLIYPFFGFEGGFTLIEANPLVSVDNSSATVAKTVKAAGTPGLNFGGSAINLTANIDFSQGTSFSMKTYSTRVGLPVSFKLESGGNGPTRIQPTTVANAWETLTFDFTGETATNLGTVTIILDDGIQGDGTDNFTMFFDDITQGVSTTVAAALDPIITFDAANTVYPLATLFGATASVDVAPARSGQPIDPNDLAGRVDHQAFVSGRAALTIIGSATGFADPIPLEPLRTRISVDVWSPRAGIPIELKIEDSVDFFQVDSDIQMTTVAGGWQTMVFDFVDADQNQSFEKLVILFDADNEKTSPPMSAFVETFYFDNVEFLPSL